MVQFYSAPVAQDASAIDSQQSSAHAAYFISAVYRYTFSLPLTAVPRSKCGWGSVILCDVIRNGSSNLLMWPSSDPYIESFDDRDLSELTQEVSAVIERARAKCEEHPKFPAHARPAPLFRRQPD